MMYNNGSVSNNILYKDICTEEFVMTIAFMQSYFMYNGAVVESHPGMLPRNLLFGTTTILPYQHEIILPFLRKNNIKPSWIDTNYMYFGICNDTTGLCGGALGKLSYIFCKTLKQAHNT